MLVAHLQDEPHDAESKSRGPGDLQTQFKYRLCHLLAV